MTDLFAADPPPPATEPLEEGAVLLRGYVAAEAPALLAEVERIATAAPFRHLVVPGGHTMSVAMTNCGRVGWVSDRTGYRYDPVDPDSGLPWPAMPEAFMNLARAWHARCLADPVVSHAFSHGYHPQHTERLAAYWAEALLGPTDYTESMGDESRVVRMHSGNGEHVEMDERAQTWLCRGPA